jgi:hypothetical protein
MFIQSSVLVILNARTDNKETHMHTHLDQRLIAVDLNELKANKPYFRWLLEQVLQCTQFLPLYFGEIIGVFVDMLNSDSWILS